MEMFICELIQEKWSYFREIPENECKYVNKEL